MSFLKLTYAELVERFEDKNLTQIAFLAMALAFTFNDMKKITT